MAKARWTYWGGFVALTAASLGMLFLFVFGFLPQRFLLELDFSESDFQYPVIFPELPPDVPSMAPTALPEARRPIPRTPAERLWSEYLPLAAAGELEAATELLARYLESHPVDIGARLELARVLWKRGRLDAAAEAYRMALSRSADPAARRELARLYATAGRWEEALAAYRDLIVRRDADVELRLEYAGVAVAAERYDVAIEAYERVATRRPDDPAVLAALAGVAAWAGDYERALRAYARLWELRPHDADLLRRYAEAATWAEDYDRAAMLYAQLALERPADPEIALARARVLYWSGRPEEAARILDALPDDFASAGADSLRLALALSLPPADSPAAGRLELARAMVLRGAVDSALTIYRTVLAEEPAADSLLLELADVFQYRAAAPGSAIAQLRLYLESRPDDSDARLRLAQLLAWSGRLEEAEVALESLLAVEPERAEAWALLGDVRRWRDERMAAAGAYERALEIDPNQPAAVEGRAALEAELDERLSRSGAMGPGGGFEYLADSDEFERARWSAGWTLGGPRTRGGGRIAVERLSGFDLAGGAGEVTAVEVGVAGERWWRLGTIRASGYVGVWIPDAGAAEPVVTATLEMPELSGGSYRVEYRHDPAVGELTTLESALADLAVDRLTLSTYRGLAEGWSLSARGGVAWIGGGAEVNRRADGALGVFFRPDDAWLLGLESGGLAYADAAPRPGRRLYWDPEWSWESVAVLGWNADLGRGWELEARATPGMAWLRERDLGSEVVFVGGASLDWRYRFGDWLLSGGAGFNQTRTGDYRSVRVRLGLERSVGR